MFEHSRRLEDCFLPSEPGCCLADLAGAIEDSPPGQAVASALRFARSAVQAKFSVFSLFDAERRRIVTHSGCCLPQDFRRAGRLDGRTCHEEFVAAGRKRAVIPDLDQTLYRKSDPDLLRHGLKSYIGAPVLQAGRVIGSLAVYDDRVRPFDESQAAWVQLTARLIGLILERQQFLHQLQGKKISDSLLADLSAKAFTTRDDSFLTFCLQNIGRTFKPDAVCFLWFDPQERSFTTHAQHWRAGTVLPFKKKYAGLERLPAVIDLTETKNDCWLSRSGSNADAATLDFLRRHRIASFLLVPICNQRKLYGICALSMQRDDRRWEEEDLCTLTAAMGIIAQWKGSREISNELDESQALIYQLFQLSPTAIYQIDFQANRFVQVNETMCRATGYTEEELLALRPEALLTPLSRQLFRRRFADMAAGLPVSPNVEFEIQTKSGQIEWGHLHIRHLNREGKIWGANVVVHLTTEQKKVQEELAEYRRRLEALVEERTHAFMQANRKLKEEVALRTETARELRIKSERLKELNTAMRVLLDKRNEDRLRSEENIRVNLVQLIDPYLERLHQSGLNPAQRQLLDVIRMNLNEVVGSPMPELSAKYYIFSPGELQVANLIRKGRTTKDMARLLNLSPRTVESYRNSIRKKLGLKNKKVNLKTYLSSKE